MFPEWVPVHQLPSSPAGCIPAQQAMHCSPRLAHHIFLCFVWFTTCVMSNQCVCVLSLLLLAGITAQEASTGLTSKQRDLLLKCNLQMRVLDAAFLEAVGQDKRSALIRALKVNALLSFAAYIPTHWSI